ncbi:hypothetical protein GMORB2_6099 [Geosmithia morbida]|uniref:Uncharacterized protein n=1 Tax=Geosmithia morbida TaxID=1094350 RepID=A0A9P4YUL5_9HYPO|nr:uncharacterized protein GMORB2_6099 [Geosmithia morbida]KAF4123398.1 hypothetical protein GMORB2_6099 [Geosmithia morbida]
MGPLVTSTPGRPLNNDVSPVREDVEARRQRQTLLTGTASRAGPSPTPQQPLPPAHLSSSKPAPKSGIPMMRRQRFKEQSRAVTPGTAAWSPSPDRQQAYGNVSTVSAAPSSSSPSSSSPAHRSRPPTSKPLSPTMASLGQRMRQLGGGSKPVPVHSRPAWNGASGRETVPPPVYDDPEAPPLSLPVNSRVQLPQVPAPPPTSTITRAPSSSPPEEAAPSPPRAPPAMPFAAAAAEQPRLNSIKSIKRKPAPSAATGPPPSLPPSQSHFSLSTASTSRPGGGSSGGGTPSGYGRTGEEAAPPSDHHRDNVMMTPRTTAGRPPSIASLSKALPPAPPEMVDTTDRVAVLSVKLDALAHRRNNVSMSIKQMTELMPADRLLESTEVLRKRGEEKAKVEKLREELAEIQQQEYQLGLKLHRAYKRQDREDALMGDDPSRLRTPIATRYDRPGEGIGTLAAAASAAADDAAADVSSSNSGSRGNMSSPVSGSGMTRE